MLHCKIIFWKNETSTPYIINLHDFIIKLMLHTFYLNSSVIKIIFKYKQAPRC